MGAAASTAQSHSHSGHPHMLGNTPQSSSFMEEEAKQFYKQRIAEILAVEFEILKKQNLTQEQLQHEIYHVLNKHESYILERPSNFTPRSFKSVSHTPRGEYLRELSASNDFTSSRVPFAFNEHAPLGHIDESNDEAKFRKLCVDTVKKITTKKSLTHMCAVDGSDGGHIAFETMMFMRKRLDHICIFHAYSKELSGQLPEEYQPTAVRSRYEAELIAKRHLPTTKFTFFFEDKKDRDIRQVIMELLNNYKGVKNPMRPTRNEPNFFFCGYTGTKGGKVANSTLGSVTDIALRSVHMPVIICKSLCVTNSRYYIIAVDGSENSRNGFEIAMALMNPRDRVECINVLKCRSSRSNMDEKNQEVEEIKSRHMSISELQEYYTTELNTYGPAKSEFKTLTCPDDKSIAECLVEYSNSMNADFFCIAPRTRAIFTSITEFVILKVEANIILCKN